MISEWSLILFLIEFHFMTPRSIFCTWCKEHIQCALKKSSNKSDNNKYLNKPVCLLSVCLSANTSSTSSAFYGKYGISNWDSVASKSRSAIAMLTLNIIVILTPPSWTFKLTTCLGIMSEFTPNKAIPNQCKHLFLWPLSSSRKQNRRARARTRMS